MRSVMGGATLALCLMAGSAFAQSSTETTTSQYSTTPAPYAAPMTPPPGTLSTSRETHSVDAYGNRSDSKATSYRDTTGVAEQSSSRTVTAAPPPPPPPMTTTTTTTEQTTTGQQ